MAISDPIRAEVLRTLRDTVPALSQVAVDLITSPGRDPNEAEALVQWMRENEDAWHASSDEAVKSPVPR